MSEAREPNYELAEQDYIFGMKYKDIAEKYNVTLNTVKSWKTRYKWSKDNKKGVHTKSEKVCTQKKDAKPIADEVKQVIDNPELTDKQRLFCLYYIKCFNATKAYQKAYECGYETAMVNGSDLLRNTKIKNQIQSLKQGKLNQSFLESDDIVQKYMDIAFLDVADYVTFGTKEVIFSNDAGMEATTEMIYVNVNESWMVDGSLISEISQGKDGIKIKFADRMKAMDWLTKYFVINPMDRHKIEYDKRRLELDLIKIDYEAKKNEPQTTTTGSDNFLDALNAKAKEVWNDEE